MRGAPNLLAAILLMTVATTIAAGERSWECPVFHTTEESVAAARRHVSQLDQSSSAALRLFVDLNLAAGDIPGAHPSNDISRATISRFLVSYPTFFLHDDVQRQTIERFQKAIPRQQQKVERRLARFGFHELPGLVYLRLVSSVDAFSGLNRAGSDRMSRVGGVTYYCRYVVLPLSYIGEDNLRELRRSAVDFDATLQHWQHQSYANLISTFRHELVHVHTSSALGVPAYADRVSVPTWFHEGTATYLAADPHAGLSERYQEYQSLFFYLVQRYGVRKLHRFYSSILGGSNVRTALSEVYSISGSEQLFTRSSHWHRSKRLIKSGFWLAALAIVIFALRGSELPVIGSLQILLALALLVAVVTGFAEHLCSLNGSAAVLAAKIVLGLLATVLGLRGVIRVRRFRAMTGSP
jgi:biopolymer transport protein ExbB/TolQ